ncbi:methenyltetrahydromethanopterin cyclohydrolase [Candidatus Thorarchaeota archaeon]|nr:MAG: methenyltetrahydromethanopterin cyclohydrolase [Candidatus Thorarchaeota archaeon]
MKFTRDIRILSEDLELKHSINKGSLEIVERIMNSKEELNCRVNERKDGAKIIDAGIECTGSAELGRLIGEVCLGGLGAVKLNTMYIGDLELPAVIVGTDYPKIATLASQYAGWTIKVGKYFAMGSGPARALAQVEKLYEKLDYKDNSKKGVIVLESRTEPSDEVTEYIAEKCGISVSNLYCIVVPTASIAGSVQISARIVEVGMHKLHEIGFDPDKVRRGHGVAPIAPVAKNDSKAMGVTNDCILYGGRTYYFVKSEDDDLKTIVKKVPSSTSVQYGQPFYKLFKSVEFDFYKIDPLLFSPAEVTINHIDTGKIYHAGELNPEVLKQSLEM